MVDYRTAATPPVTLMSIRPSAPSRPSIEVRFDAQGVTSDGGLP
jgi:hypothetical protein